MFNPVLHKLFQYVRLLSMCVCLFTVCLRQMNIMKLSYFIVKHWHKVNCIFYHCCFHPHKQCVSTDGNEGRSTTDWNIPTTIEWFSMKYFTDIQQASYWLWSSDISSSVTTRLLVPTELLTWLQTLIFVCWKSKNVNKLELVSSYTMHLPHRCACMDIAHMHIKVQYA